MYVVFFILIFMAFSQCKILIKGAGFTVPNEYDMGLLFYVTVENVADTEYNINTEMVDCCMNVAANDVDCKLMHLIGGDMDIAYPNFMKNFTLIYPSMYPYGRSGTCTIRIRYLDPIRGGEAHETVKVDFKTDYPERLRVVEERCCSVDLDPMKNCEPVDCHMKYLGRRNYYNYTFKRCQEVPVCIYDCEKDLPDVAYIPLNNKCRDLENTVDKDDLLYMRSGSTNNTYYDPSDAYMVNINCHEGKLNSTKFCQCNRGWTSARFVEDEYEPSLSIIHMCTIDGNNWGNFNYSKIRRSTLLAMIFAVVATISLLTISLCLHVIYRCIRAIEYRTCDMESDDDSTE